MESLYPLLLLRHHRGGEDRSFNQVWKSPSAVGLCSSLYLNMTSCADEKTLDLSRDIMGISNLLPHSSTPRLGPGPPPMNVKTRTKSWKKETNPADHGTKSKSRGIRIRINLENGPIGAQGGNHLLHQLFSLRIQIHSAWDLKYLYHNLLVPYLELRPQGRISHPNLDYCHSSVLDLERLLPSNLPITGLIQVQIKVPGLHVSQNLSRRKRPFYPPDLRQGVWIEGYRVKQPTGYMCSWSMNGLMDWKGGVRVVCKGKGDHMMWGKVRMVKQSVRPSSPSTHYESSHFSTYSSRHKDGADSLVVQCYRCLGGHRSPLPPARIRLRRLDRGYRPPLWFRIHHMSYVSQICPSSS